MKCQYLCYGKNTKNISICRLLKVLPRLLSLNGVGQNVAFGQRGNINLKVVQDVFSLKGVYFSPGQLRSVESQCPGVLTIYRMFVHESDILSLINTLIEERKLKQTFSSNPG